MRSLRRIRAVIKVRIRFWVHIASLNLLKGLGLATQSNSSILNLDSILTYIDVVILQQLTSRVWLSIHMMLLTSNWFHENVLSVSLRDSEIKFYGLLILVHVFGTMVMRNCWKSHQSNSNHNKIIQISRTSEELADPRTPNDLDATKLQKCGTDRTYFLGMTYLRIPL